MRPALLIAVCLLVACSAFGEVFVQTGSMLNGRYGHASVRLADGRVLVIGGGGGNEIGYAGVTSAEIYNPATGAWTATGSMRFVRVYPAAALLADGRVLVAGGYASPQTSATQKTAEIYDPATGLWTETGTPTTGEAGQSLTLLRDGKALLVGGSSAAELFDPAAARWMTAGPVVSRRGRHHAVTLHSGKVLFAGASTGSTDGRSCELYEPVTGAFSSTGSLSTGRSWSTAALLPSGEVLIAGGGSHNAGVTTSTDKAEIYDPAAGTWRPTASLSSRRQHAASALLADGRVLVSGGVRFTNNGGPMLSDAEVYDPVSSTWTAVGQLAYPRDLHSATQLADGTVLIAGGIGSAGERLARAELFDPAAPNLSTVSITSNRTGLATSACPGDVVTLSFTTSQPITSLPAVTLLGQQVTPVEEPGNSWSAAATVSSTTPPGPAAFAIVYRHEGREVAPVKGTTDGSAVTIDTRTEPPTTSTPGYRSFSTSMSVDFNLPETPLPGSVKLIFQAYPSLDVVSTLTLAAGQEVAGNRTFTFDPGDPLANPEVSSGTALQEGTYRLTISYRDSAGNPAEAVTIYALFIDTTPPVITRAWMDQSWARPGSVVRVHLSTDERRPVSVSGSIAGAAAKGGASENPSASAVLPSDTAEGPLSFSISATDAAGNVSAPVTTTSDGLYTMVDGTPPVLTVPGPIVAEATSRKGAIVTFTVTATDNLFPNPHVHSYPSSGELVTLGEREVLVEAIDGAGNATRGTFMVTVVDTIPPTARVPSQLRVQAGPTGEAALGDLRGNVTSSDAVGVARVVQSPPASTVYPLGSYPITFTVSDGSGNSTTVTTTVTVSSEAGPPAGISVAAESGMSAPSSPGLPADAVLSTFGPPAVSDSSDLTARVTMLSGAAQIAGIYLVDAAGKETLPAFQGSSVPDADGSPLPGRTFAADFLDPVIAPNGAIAFAGRIEGARAEKDEGVWTNAFGPLAMILREGSDLAGLPAGAKLRAVRSLSLRNGQLLALVTLKTAKGIVTAADNKALVLFTGPGAATLLLRTGAELLDTPGARINTFSVLESAAGSRGQGRWHGDDAVLAKVTLTSGELRLVRVATNGTVKTLLSTADAATPVDAQAKWKSFGVPAMDSAGQEFVVAAALHENAGEATAEDPGSVTAENDTVLLFSSDRAAWNILARERALKPTPPLGATPPFSAFSDPVVNDAGKVAFLATLHHNGLAGRSKNALFAGDSASVNLVAHLGDPAPDESGKPGGPVWSRFITHALPSGRGANLVFLAETRSRGATAKRQIGLWAIDSQGALRRILRCGKPLTNGGPLLSSLALLRATPGSSGVARSYNQTGALAVLATFADETQALLRVELP